jgi:hypothetical protein
MQGDYAAALALLDDAKHIFDDTAELRGSGAVLNTVGRVRFARSCGMSFIRGDVVAVDEDIKAAEVALERAMDVYTSIYDAHGRATAAAELARVQIAVGLDREARALLADEGLLGGRELDPQVCALTLHCRTLIAQRSKQPIIAIQFCAEAAGLMTRQNVSEESVLRFHLGWLYRSLGELVAARREFGRALSLFQGMDRADLVVECKHQLAECDDSHVENS